MKYGSKLKRMGYWAPVGGMCLFAIAALAEAPSQNRNEAGQAPRSQATGAVTSMAHEIWPNGTPGCESGSLIMEVGGGVVVLSPSAHEKGFGNARISSTQRRMIVTLGEPTCLIRVSIEAIIDTPPSDPRR